MILIKNIFMLLIGIAGGFTIAAGIFAFIVMLGVINRLASRTETARFLSFYEDAIIVGGTIGNLVTVFSINVPVGVIGIVVYGFFCGVFVGCLAMALAEVAKVVPVFAKRIKLVHGMPFIVISIALGKAFGAFYQLYWR